MLVFIECNRGRSIPDHAAAWIDSSGVSLEGGGRREDVVNELDIEK